VRARAESQGVDCNIGIAERAVRMIILMVGSLIGYFAGDIYFTYTIYLLVILSYFTVGQRIVYVWRQLK
ncbi:MAG: CDP-alcohol phosphatidyltransferase family protein, partial [Methanobrevibacter sp.]|nr:CDP-alcohol phosphatidyltransferase family protein [Methanobrevibacter sp.]